MSQQLKPHERARLNAIVRPLHNAIFFLPEVVNIVLVYAKHHQVWFEIDPLFAEIGEFVENRIVDYSGIKNLHTPSITVVLAQPTFRPSRPSVVIGNKKAESHRITHSENLERVVGRLLDVA